MILTILKYILIGFIASIPVGPISIIIIRRTINKSKWHGIYSGAGTALSDSLYALLAGIGLTYLFKIIEANEAIIRFGGAGIIILIGLGIVLKTDSSHLNNGKSKRMSYFQDFSTTALLAFTNPFVTLIYMGLYTATHTVINWQSNDVWFLFPSLFLGCNLWWICLTFIVSKFKNRLNDVWLHRFNRLTGITIIILATASIISYILK